MIVNELSGNFYDISTSIYGAHVIGALLRHGSKEDRQTIALARTRLVLRADQTSGWSCLTSLNNSHNINGHLITFSRSSVPLYIIFLTSLSYRIATSRRIHNPAFLNLDASKNLTTKIKTTSKDSRVRMSTRSNLLRFLPQQAEFSA